jgi:hypothetical protein
MTAPQESATPKAPDNPTSGISDNLAEEATAAELSAALESKPWLRETATDILDKQYRLYSWNDSKSLTLITTNSVLLAGIGFIFKECLADSFALLTIALALILVGTSLFVSLRQVNPQGSSGKTKGKRPNIRALSGIATFKSWESYEKALYESDEGQVFTDTVRQVYGMAYNNDISRKTIARGVWLTRAGILLIWLSVVGVVLSARDIHPLGKWVAKSQEMSQNTESLPIKEDVSIVQQDNTKETHPSRE